MSLGGLSSPTSSNVPLMSTHVAPRAGRPARVGYRVRDLVEMTGLSQQTIRRWIADGRLEAFHVGRSVLVRPESVDRLFGDAR